MKTPKFYIGAFAVFCIAALIIGTAGAVANTNQGTGNNLKINTGQFRSVKMLDNLTAKGYDVSAIRTATTSGDYKTAQTLMQEFRTAHPDLFPAHPQAAGKVQMTDKAKGDKMLLWLNNLTAKGYDVSAIRTATTSGDYKTAQTLIQEFRTAHPDLFSAHPQGAGKVQMTDQAKGDKMLLTLSNLTAKGYDVSTIRTAVTSGDYKTAQTLMQEFRTAHPDVFPAHAQKAGNGNLSWQRGAQNNQ